VNYKNWRSIAMLSFSLAVSIHAQAGWEEKLFNPKPVADDVILPMPCEGSMAFRKVYIPLAGPLEDYPIQSNHVQRLLPVVLHPQPVIPLATICWLSMK
jgi:hypothetical protein